MHRRRFLAGVAAGTTAAAAGCSLLGGGGGGGPTAPVEDLAAAYAEDDPEAATDAIHPEGPLAASRPDGPVDAASIEIESTSVVEEGDGEESDDGEEAETGEDAEEDRETVAAEVTVETSAGSWTEQREFQVRKYEGSWRVWSITTGPELALADYVRAVDEGRAEDATGALHPDSADRRWVDETVVQAASLTVASAGQTAAGPDEAQVDATIEETVAGETATHEIAVPLRRSEGAWTVWTLQYGPVRPVFAFVDAINENDPSAYEATLHPDADAAIPQASTLELLTMGVDSISVADVDSGQATVDTRLEINGAVGDSTDSFVLRPHGGAWAILDVEAGT